MTEQSKYKKAARAVIVDDKNRVAIIDVRNGEYFKIPGGGIEEGETVDQAVRREAMEEAGSEIKIVQDLGEQKFVDPGPDYNNLIHHSVCFLARKTDEHKNPSFDDWEKSNNFQLLWVDFDEAFRLFERSRTEDPYGQAINERDFQYLRKAREILGL